MKMKIYSYSLPDLQYFSNQIKEVVASSLVKEGFLTEEQSIKFVENYIVLVTEKGFVGKAMDTILGLDKKEKDSQIIHVVKRV